MAFPTRANSTPRNPLDQRATRYRRVCRRVGSAPASGADQHGRQPAPAPPPPARIMLSLDDLLWHKTSEDHDGRITLGLLASSRSIGVLVDDNGQSLGLRLSRAEAQDLHRALVAWLAATEPASTPC